MTTEIVIAPRQHHEHGMSKLNHLADCPGFRRKEETSAAAEEGTGLHDVCQNIIEGWVGMEVRGSFLEYMELCLLGRKEILSEEQRESIRQTLQTIARRLENWAEEVYTEEKVGILCPDGSNLNFGHVDLILIGKINGKPWAFLYDFKFGRTLVRAAISNYQGLGYGLALLQSRTELECVTITFIQPRVLGTTSTELPRSQIPVVYGEILRIIERSKDPNAERKVCDACKYCAHAGNCAALTAWTASIAASYHNLPAIPTFHGSEITDPKQMALALYFVKRAEPAFDSVRKAAVEMAKMGMPLEVTFHGQLIKFDLKERRADRILGPAPLIWEAVQDVLKDPVLFTGAVDVVLGRLETLYVEARYQQAMANDEKTDEGKKFTKKAALLEFHRRLEDAGLISRPDTATYYLKEVNQQTEQHAIDV